jgi:penicillin-binding protein 1A
VNPILLRTLRWFAIGLGSLFLAFAFALACTFVYLAPSLPSAENTQCARLAVPLRVYTRDGGLIAQIGEQRRIPVEYEEIPMVVRQAVLAAEDAGFFEHRGFEWRGIVRAIVMNLVTADAGQGGSTITQQAARNLCLSLDKTLRRKLAEVFVTWRMEREFTKEQILATYLNVITFGHRSYGIAAAAQTYYGKHLGELTVGEAATLAGIIQRPSAQNPITNPKLAEMRRGYVLRRMQELGFIDSATAAAAAKEPVGSRGFAPLIDVEAPYVAEMVRQELVARFGEAAVNAGYKVYTTIDGRQQVAANRAVRLGLMEFDRPRGYRGPLGKVTLPATAGDAELDALLNEFPSVNLLVPAVVTSVAATSAEVHVRGQGRARISWDGLSWARKALRNGTGAAPRTAGEVVRRGDVVHVITDGRGNAQLAQVPEAQAALVALDPEDGAIVALTGGFDFYSNQYNRATQANRGAGSSFKPFLYSAALDNGFTPSSIIMDIPLLLDDSGGNSEEIWRPENSTRNFGGPMRLREALVRSRNLVSIRILQELGIDRFIEHAAKFGFEPSKMPRNWTLALGTQAVTPLQITTGFAAFANGGFKVEPYYIERIEDASGNVVYRAEPKLACAPCEQSPEAPQVPDMLAAVPGGEVATVTVGEEEAAAYGATPGLDGAPGLPAPAAAGAAGIFSPAVMAATVGPGGPQGPVLFGNLEDVPAPMRELSLLQGGAGFLPEERLAPRIISPQNAWLISDILHDVTVRGTAARSRALGRDDLAGKTGTNEDRDNWFVGFTRDIVAGVWLGYDDYRSLGARAEGSSTALPIWMHFMEEALKGTPSSRPRRPAEGLIDLRIDPYTGKLAHAADPEAIVETFMVNALPEAPRPGEPGYVPPGVEVQPGTAAPAGPLF